MRCQEFVEAGPSDHALTSTPRQPLAPNSHYLIGEPAQASTVTANAVVGEVAPHHRAQMAMLVADGPVAGFPTPTPCPRHRAGQTSFFPPLAHPCPSGPAPAPR